MRFYLLAAPALLLLPQAGQRQNSDEPAPDQAPAIEREIPAGPSDEPPADPRAAEPIGPAAAVVRLPDGLTAATPKLFAEKLSEALGVEVAMPEELPRPVIIPPAEYTVPKLLKRVAKETDCTWSRVFDLSRQPNESDGTRVKRATNLLGPAGAVTLYRRCMPAEAARAIERAVGCRVSLPVDCPDGRMAFDFVDTAAEKILAILAERLVCHVRQKLVFERASNSAKPVTFVLDDEQECMDTLNEVTEQKGLLLDQMALATGMDPDDEQFPWETMVGLSGVVPGLSPDQFLGILVQMQVEAEMRSSIRALDSDTGGLPNNPLGDREP